MSVKRGDNSMGFKVDIVATSVEDEMSLLETLGRATRDAICNAPIKFSVVSLIDALKEQEVLLGQELDPQNPDLDRYLAREVMMQSAGIIARDRSREDALNSVRPLVARISVKSIREQRRSLRKVRW